MIHPCKLLTKLIMQEFNKKTILAPHDSEASKKYPPPLKMWRAPLSKNEQFKI